ncbi:unnamed protein product, partial [Staurois parvus]
MLAVSAYQCHLPVPISATSMPHISAHLSCLSVPPISASQCHLSMPVSATYQCCQSVPPTLFNKFLFFASFGNKRIHFLMN